MAIWGELVFYALHEPQNPEEWILQLCRLSGAQSVALLCWRLLHPTWRFYCYPRSCCLRCIKMES
jgi:hypothetical protein